MAKRKESMLEAFQASAAETKGNPGKAASPQEVGGPFAPLSGESGPGVAGGAPLPGRPVAARPRTRRGVGSGTAGMDAGLGVAPSSASFGPFGSVTFLFVQILLLAGAFALGRLTGGVRAAAGEPQSGSEATSQPLAATVGGTEPAGQAPEARPAAGEGAGQELEFTTQADLAFEDPANKYSIQVIQYANAESELNRTLAYKTYDHLQERGLPVVRPWRKGNNIFIYVGAAPSTKDLSELLQRVKNTPGPHGSTNAFADAFLVPIPD